METVSNGDSGVGDSVLTDGEDEIGKWMLSEAAGVSGMAG